MCCLLVYVLPWHLEPEIYNMAYPLRDSFPQIKNPSINNTGWAHATIDWLMELSFSVGITDKFLLGSLYIIHCLKQQQVQQAFVNIFF